MPDLPTAHEAIYTRLFEEWSDAGQTEPIMVAERPQDPLAAAFNSTGGPWLRLSVNHTTGDQSSDAEYDSGGDRRDQRQRNVEPGSDEGAQHAPPVPQDTGPQPDCRTRIARWLKRDLPGGSRRSRSPKDGVRFLRGGVAVLHE